MASCLVSAGRTIFWHDDARSCSGDTPTESEIEADTIWKARVKGILEPNLIGVSLKFQPARPTSTTWTNAEVVLQRGTEGVIVPGLSLRSKETQLMDNPSSVEPAITPTQYCNRVMSQHMDRPRKVDFYLAECLAIRKVVPTVQCKWTVMQ
jgi:hypothetical protein